MSGTDRHSHSSGSKPENDVLEELFRHASARKRPPAEDEQSIRDALHQQWQQKIRVRRRNKWTWSMAIAASVALFAIIGVSINPFLSPAVPVQQLAVAEKIIGSALARSETGTVALQNAAERQLFSGQTIITTKGAKLALRWEDGTGIRLDELTELSLDSKMEIRLHAGRIYIDTQDQDPGLDSDFVVKTSQGEIRHLGTQYMTEVSTRGTRVLVREGEVALQPGSGNQQQQTIARVGQALAVMVTGEIQVESVEIWGSDWEWAEALSAGFDTSGNSLAELFAWAGRESGREVVYESGQVRSMAEEAYLVGDFDLEPVNALIVATETTDLSAVIDQGLIRVKLKE